VTATTTPTPDIVILDDVHAIAREAARRVRRSAAAAIAARGRWSVALSGGSTPRPLYRALDGGDPSERIDWARADLFFGDERTVPPDHPESNYRMARETLLSRVPVPAERVHRMRGEAPDLSAAAAAYEAELRSFDPAPIPVIDLVLLGMGPDGHTASLFPGTTALDERQRLCVPVDVPKLATRRLTLTYPVFEAAREVLFLIVGQDKAHTLREAVEGPARPRDFPCQAVLRRAAGAVTIFCDREAATELPTQAPGRPRPRTP
jgi:6-phosphogluconolactonase